MAADNYIPFKVDNEMYTTLTNLASKQNTSRSEVIRKLINIALQKELAKESIDFVRDQINEEIKATCFPQFERLAKLEAKIGYQSVASFYLLAYIMSEILPPSKQKDFEDVQRKSKAMAIAYLKLNTQEFADFAQSEDKSIDILNLK